MSVPVAQTLAVNMHFSALTRTPNASKNPEWPIAKAASAPRANTGGTSDKVKKNVTSKPLSSPLMRQVSPESCPWLVLPEAESCCHSMRAGRPQLCREVGTLLWMGRHKAGRFPGGILLSQGSLCGPGEGLGGQYHSVSLATRILSLLNFSLSFCLETRCAASEEVARAEGGWSPCGSWHG